MNRFLTVVNATSRVVQNCRVAKFLLYGHDHHEGFAANEERMNYMYSLRLPDQFSENVVTCNANNCSAHQWNNDPRRAGITSVIYLRASKGGGEQVVRHLSKNVRCIQNHRTFPDTWCYTCYVPQDETVKIPRLQGLRSTRT